MSQESWDALADTPVTKGMDFDKWVRECCLEPFIKEYDPDYAAVARLYLVKKSEAHQK
jgi:hypothetical protein